jgi:hypothetical protein
MEYSWRFHSLLASQIQKKILWKKKFVGENIIIGVKAA